MAKLTLIDIASGYASIQAINSNNTLIEAAIENTLSRDGSTPNSMSADLDLGSNQIINLGAPGSASEAARLQDVTDAGLANTTTSMAATLVSIADSANAYPNSTNVEGALQDLNSDLSGRGATIIGLANNNNYYTSGNVEDTLDQIAQRARDNYGRYMVATGVADAQVVSPAIPAPNNTAGQRWSFKPVANNTGACTLQVTSSASVISIKLQDGTDPAAGDLDATGISEVIYDGTFYILLNPVEVPALFTKVLDIGDWDMDTNASANVAHGIADFTKIRGITAVIINDSLSSTYDFNYLNLSETTSRYLLAGTTNITLTRSTGGFFDNTGYSTTPFNRGWITIQYID